MKVGSGERGGGAMVGLGVRVKKRCKESVWMN